MRSRKETRQLAEISIDFVLVVAIFCYSQNDVEALGRAPSEYEHS